MASAMHGAPLDGGIEMLSPKKISLTVVTLGAGLVLGGGCVAPSADESLGTRAEKHVIEQQNDDAAKKAEEAGEEAAEEAKETGEEAAKEAEEKKEEAAEEAKERGEKAAEEAEEAKEKAAEEAEELGEKAAEEAEEKVDQQLRADEPFGRRFDRRRDHRRDRDHRWDRDRDRRSRARVCNVRDDFHCERGHRGWRWAWVSAPSADRWGHHDRRERERCCVRVRDHRR